MNIVDIWRFIDEDKKEVLAVWIHDHENPRLLAEVIEFAEQETSLKGWELAQYSNKGGTQHRAWVLNRKDTECMKVIGG